ncbi:MAG: hypothetical protein IPO93_15515 [Actinobacteria bacterium]|nr:hypothetical protein [Actinomycetota bacterium]
MLLSWRWLDKREGLWTALVRCHREGLTYEHWLSGELLDVETERAEAEQSRIWRELPSDGMVRPQTQPPVMGSAHFCQLFVQPVRHASSRWKMPYACTHDGMGGASAVGATAAELAGMLIANHDPFPFCSKRYVALPAATMVTTALLPNIPPPMSIVLTTSSITPVGLALPKHEVLLIPVTVKVSPTCPEMETSTLPPPNSQFAE